MKLSEILKLFTKSAERRQFNIYVGVIFYSSLHSLINNNLLACFKAHYPLSIKSSPTKDIGWKTTNVVTSHGMSFSQSTIAYHLTPVKKWKSSKEGQSHFLKVTLFLKTITLNLEDSFLIIGIHN